MINFLRSHKQASQAEELPSKRWSFKLCLSPRTSSQECPLDRLSGYYSEQTPAWNVTFPADGNSSAESALPQSEGHLAITTH